MSKKITTEKFIEKARKVHGDKYDYSKVKYINSQTKVCIICKEHGEFWQVPKYHLDKCGCQYCGGNKKLTTEEFIERARKIHGDKYIYTKTNLYNRDEKGRVCIICPEHGDFWQNPTSHLNGIGCSACKGLKKLTTEEFIKRAREVHGDKYDYSKVEYKNKSSKVEIICPIHGSFFQAPHNHVFQKQGCPECGKKYAAEWRKNDYTNFLKSSIDRFGNNYVFPFIDREYENSHSKITIRCIKCGNIFNKIACDHITSPNGGCQHCYYKSKPEEDISNFILKLLPNTDIYLNDRKILNGMELDVYIPKKKIAFEFDGLYWHSNKDKNYHLLKTEMCENKNIKLIHIFEDELKYKKEILLSKITHIIGCNNNPKIQARKCIIKEIDYNKSKDFLEKNHIQGECKSTVYLGAFFNEKLISVMLFKKETINKWELTRFASDINYQVIGIGGKLFKYFIKNYNPTYIKSFADRRWTSLIDENLYDKLGFKKDNILKPDYRYFFKGTCKRFHKFGFRKQVLIKKYPDKGLTMDMTEKEMCDKLGFYRIWDCGLIKYVWTKN